MPDKIVKPARGSATRLRGIDVPLFIYNGGGNDEVSTSTTSFQSLKILPTEIVTVKHDVLVTIQFVLECRVTGGHALKARIGRTNAGPYPCLDNTVVLTNNPKYETHSHMTGFRLPAGEHELYLEWCVTGGKGYIRYRFFTVILSSI
jgi:hypothetical protein